MGTSKCERMVVAVVNKGIFGKYLNSTDDDFRIFQKPSTPEPHIGALYSDFKCMFLHDWVPCFGRVRGPQRAAPRRAAACKAGFGLSYGFRIPRDNNLGEGFRV